MSAETLIGGFLVVAFAYPVVMRILAHAAEGRRAELEKLGNELVHTDALSTADRRVTAVMVRDALDWREMWGMAILLPIAVVAVAFNIAHARLPAMPKDPALKAKLKRVASLYASSIAAANPLAALIFALEFGLLSAALFLLGKITLPVRLFLKVVKDTGSLPGHGKPAC